jgi:hypothetical protein
VTVCVKPALFAHFAIILALAIGAPIAATPFNVTRPTELALDDVMLDTLLKLILEDDKLDAATELETLLLEATTNEDEVEDTAVVDDEFDEAILDWARLLCTELMGAELLELLETGVFLLSLPPQLAKTKTLITPV